MNDDIVTRLRTVDEFSDAVKIMDQAADEIELLRADIARILNLVDRSCDEIERLRAQVADLKNLYRLRSQLGDAVGR